MDKLLTDFPRLPVIIAHPGEYDAYMAKLELLRRHPNAFLDICGTGLFRYGMLKYGVDQVGAGRFLFGTDFPVCSVGMQVGGVLTEDLTPAERQAIFADNAKRLLHL
jgi:predicted TIM-barrel fold metal-dependent hydrolase